MSQNRTWEIFGLSGYPLQVQLFHYKSDLLYIRTKVHSSGEACQQLITRARAVLVHLKKATKQI
jgi:hypothetical protein